MRAMLVMVAALALGACGEGGGGDEAGQAGPDTAPECEVPADLACPEGTTSEERPNGTARGRERVVTMCVGDGVQQGIVETVGGEVAGYSPPPWDTAYRCYPPGSDGRALTAMISTGRGGTEHAVETFYMPDGTIGERHAATDAYNAAWGFGE